MKPIADIKFSKQPSDVATNDYSEDCKRNGGKDTKVHATYSSTSKQGFPYDAEKFSESCDAGCGKILHFMR